MHAERQGIYLLGNSTGAEAQLNAAAQQLGASRNIPFAQAYMEAMKLHPNFYATNFHLGSISPLFIHQLGRARWRIGTEVFQTITVDCYLKHAAAHQSTALVVLSMIRVLAYKLSLVFYQYQVRSHASGRGETFHEIAQRIGDFFVADALDTS